MSENYMEVLEKVYDLFEQRKCSAKWFDEMANHIHKELWKIEQQAAA
ncbi:hypothetical protein ER45_030465 (plasmid) [Bacillus mycoides]|nr:hypothetical protein ER45_030465 [Bacillus mycoides]